MIDVGSIALLMAGIGVLCMGIGLSLLICFWCFDRLAIDAGAESVPVGVNLNGSVAHSEWCGEDVPGAYDEPSLKERLGKAEVAIASAKIYLDAVVTCHVCEGTVIMDSGPVHCEDCSFDCDSHEPPDCEQPAELHSAARRAIDDYFGREDG